MSVNWDKVQDTVIEKVKFLGTQERGVKGLLYGQDRAALFIAKKLSGQAGVVLADEVGLGKTRVALLIADAVMSCGGNVAVVVPPGLLAQWENEYKLYKMQLRESPNASIKLRRFEDLFNYGSILGKPRDGFPLAVTKKNRWVLLSHCFGFHQVRTNSPAWRIELPALVRAAHEYDAPYRNRWREYAQIREYDEEDAFGWWGQYWKAAKFLSKKMSYVFKDQANGHFLQRNDLRPSLKNSADNGDLNKLYVKDGDGYEIMLELIGLLIGDIDLLIIDEAHKSRDDWETPEKQLGVLVEKIIRQNKNSRRLCLTATPVELDPSQWDGLLKRAGLSAPLTAINGFFQSLVKARTSPDNPEVIDELIKSAKEFESGLNRFVVRRRRINQAEMKKYFDGTPVGAHPHRELTKIPISFEHLDTSWRRATLAFEGQGLAAKGLEGIGMRERLLDIRHAHALINDFDDENRGTEVINPKDGRRRFWGKTAAVATGIKYDATGLMAHPRVQCAADQIERQLGILTADSANREKYLVFGRFSTSMKALSKELNARYILRCVDLSLPVPAGNFDEEEIYSCYIRLMSLRDPGVDVRSDILLIGKLNEMQSGSCLTKENLISLIKEAHELHRSAREYVSKVLNREFLDEHLPGNDAINRLTPEQRENLYSLIRLDVYSNLSSELHTPDLQTSKAAAIRSEAVRIWAQYLEQIIEGVEIDFHNATRSEWRGNAEYYDVDAKGDCVDPAHLAAVLELHESGEARQSSFCRLLDSDVPHPTRKVLQAQFNNMVFPRVLIAQSIIGREGLNLHKMCRRVLLFHPEWNPAVVEQQIGRVDRINSLWTSLADTWLAEGKNGPMPKISVEYLLFEGTYDDYQYQVLQKRRQDLNSQLFGELLDHELFQKVNPDRQNALLDAAPNFDP